MSIEVQALTLDETIHLALSVALDKRATDPVAIRVGERFGFAEAFLVLSGDVERQVQAISDAIEGALNSRGVRTIRREGREHGRWVLVDFGDLVVHIFHQEDRGYYQLERLWEDCPGIELPEGELGSAEPEAKRA